MLFGDNHVSLFTDSDQRIIYWWGNGWVWVDGRNNSYLGYDTNGTDGSSHSADYDESCYINAGKHGANSIFHQFDVANGFDVGLMETWGDS